MKLKHILGLSFLAALISVQAAAKDFKPGVVYDMGTRFDKSFNQAVYDGMERFKKETKISYREFELTNQAQSEQFLRQLAQRNSDIIVVVGFAQAPSVKKVAAEFPDVKFTLIDAVVDLPNVQSVVFKEEEGSFLVGALAAMASKTHKLGFIGGMDVPLIRRFACGYEQGAKHINPKIELIQNMVGNTPDAWSDPAKGADLAASQFDRGVDVIYSAAAKSSIGVLQTAADRNKLAIGVDSNQNYLYPGHVLTSMVKDMDVAAYDAVKDAYDGKWKAGTRVMGLKDDGVSWSEDEYNKPLITPEMEKKMADLKAQIINGKIKITDYMTNNSCTY